MANKGNRLAQTVLPVLEDPHKLDSYVAASQVGITLSNIVLGTYGQQQTAPLIEPWLAALVWAIYHNFTPAQYRSERKRRYRHPGLSRLQVAGFPLENISYADALGV